jgi:hypothetical protein
MGWRLVGTTVVLTLALAGCGSRGLDAGLVASHVKTFEGDDVEVKSCEQTGEAISNNEYGAKLDEVWRCEVQQRGESSVFAESCYVVYDELESGVVRGIRCAAAGPGCPAGGSREGNAKVRLLGRVIDPELVLEGERGNSAPFTTVRVVVHYQAEAARERCGYLNVRVPVVDDPLARAAERVEASGFSASRYSFSYSVVDS